MSLGYWLKMGYIIMWKGNRVERILVAPIDYGLLEHTIMLDLSHFYKFFPKNGNIRSNAAVT